MTAWEQRWRRFDVGLSGPAERALRILRLHLFHVLQTLSAAHRRHSTSGVPARGLHGEAYRGHVLWDELFVLPLLNLHVPAGDPGAAALPVPAAARGVHAPPRGRAAPARCTRGSRAATGARRPSGCTSTRARGGGCPTTRHLPAPRRPRRWRTTSGSTARPPADRQFLRPDGAEMILQIARFFASLADTRPRPRPVRHPRRDGTRTSSTPATRAGRRTGIDNNAYTNVMAAWVLRRALDAAAPAAAAAPRRAVDHARPGAGRGCRAGRTISRSHVRAVPADGVISQFEGYERAGRARLGAATAVGTATSAGWTGSSRRRATTSTATRRPSRPTC